MLQYQIAVVRVFAPFYPMKRPCLRGEEGTEVLEELKQGQKVVGAKQTRRALKDGRAKKLFMAKDADPRLLQPLVQEAVRTGVRVEQVDTMKRLGEACGIAVGAAVAVLV